MINIRVQATLRRKFASLTLILLFLISSLPLNFVLQNEAKPTISDPLIQQRETSYLWSTFHNDNQRTGYTNNPSPNTDATNFDTTLTVNIGEWKDLPWTHKGFVFKVYRQQNGDLRFFVYGFHVDDLVFSTPIVQDKQVDFEITLPNGESLTYEATLISVAESTAAIRIRLLSGTPQDYVYQGELVASYVIDEQGDIQEADNYWVTNFWEGGDKEWKAGDEVFSPSRNPFVFSLDFELAYGTLYVDSTRIDLIIEYSIENGENRAHVKTPVDYTFDYGETQYGEWKYVWYGASMEIEEGKWKVIRRKTKSDLMTYKKLELRVALPNGAGLLSARPEGYLVSEENGKTIITWNWEWVKEYPEITIIYTLAVSPKFLTLPFRDPDIKIQQGWRYNAPIGPDPTDPYAHNGIDYIKSSVDDPSTWQSFDVAAAADGLAMQSSGGGYGTFVYIRHDEKDSMGNNYFTLYAHLDSVNSKIVFKPRGDTDYLSWTPVKRGEIIGRAGSTGVADSSWIHLHFEVQRGRYAQNKTDPYDLYKTRDFYPGGSKYTGCGPNYLWTTDPPHLPPNAEPVITSPLEIAPKDLYYVGDTLTAKFTITNRGTESVTFNVLVVGGRDPTGEVVDFDKAYGIALNPSDSYNYQGSLILPDKPGNYHFFCAYQTPDGKWNTNIDVEINGKIMDSNEARRYRERDIIVFEKTYISPAPPPALWEKISGPWEGKSVELSQIAVHPNNPEVIYAVVKHNDDGDELYKSTNGGKRWMPINEGLPRLLWSKYYWPISAIAIAPSDPNIIYVGTSCLDPYNTLFPGGKGIYKSVDGGATWFESNIKVTLPPYSTPEVFPEFPKYDISSIVVDPTNPDVVYVGTIGGGIWRTTDGGKSWWQIWEIPYGKETSLDVNALAISSANPNIIYATAYNYAQSEAMGWSGILIPAVLIKSEDGGNNWETLQKLPFGKIDDIAVSERNAEILYVITGVTQSYRVDKSLDGGKTWSDASGTGGSDPLPDVYPVLRTIGIYGTTGKMGSISMHPDYSDVIFAAGAWGFNDVYFSPNSGENWFPLGLKDKYGQELALHIRELAFASNSRVLYAAEIHGLFKIDLSGGTIVARQHSPGELRVYDSQGRVTGLVNGKIKEEISNSAYFNNTVEILFLSDSYCYEIAGTEDGAYGLVVASVIQGESNTFTATDIPTASGAIHQYAIDWDALSLGEEGVTVQLDSDGDGTFEKTFTSDSELTQDEFMLQVAPIEAFPVWIAGVAVATIVIATATITIFWRRGKKPSMRMQLQKLQSMYDRGEISRETYLKLKSELEKTKSELNRKE